MSKFFITILIIVTFPSIVLAKNYKGYLCHFWTAYMVVGDEGLGGPSYYKHYYGQSFKNKTECDDHIIAFSERPDIIKKYPMYGDNFWFAGCDKRW